MSHINKIIDADPHFSIDPITRRIKNESSKKVTLIQGDHKSERFSFDMPREIEGHDMTKCNRVEVHYLNIENGTKAESVGLYDVDDMQIHPDDSEKVVFTWLLTSEATKYVGSLSFLIRFCCTGADNVVEYVWHTAINTDFSISNGMNNAETVAETFPDIIAQWKEKIFGDAGVGGIKVDSVLDENSENPVQNKVITNTLNSQKYYGDMNIVPTDNSLFEWGDADIYGFPINGFSKEEEIENLVIPYENNNTPVYFIDVEAFKNNTFFKTVSFPSSITHLGDYAFYGCSNLTNVIGLKGIKEIWGDVFGNCTELKSITLPNTITTIYQRVFDGSSLTDIYYEGTEEQWNSINIDKDNETLLNATIHFNWVAVDTYATKTDYASNDTAGVVKAYDGDHGSYGVKINSNGKLQLDCAYGSEIRAKKSQNSPITPAYADVVVNAATHQTMSDDYDVSSLVLCATESGKQGGYPVSYDAVKGYINSQVGDISTALDAIIAIDNKLLGVSE